MDRKKLAAYRFSTLSTPDKKWILNRLNKSQKLLLKNKAKELSRVVGKKRVLFSELLGSEELFRGRESTNLLVGESKADEFVDTESLNSEFFRLIEGLSSFELRKYLDGFSDYIIAVLSLLVSNMIDGYLDACRMERRVRVKKIASALRGPLPDALVVSVKRTIVQEWGGNTL